MIQQQDGEETGVLITQYEDYMYSSSSDDEDAERIRQLLQQEDTANYDTDLELDDHGW